MLSCDSWFNIKYPRTEEKYMKVLFITNIPSPYRLKFFEELGKYCDLDVVFERKTSAERDSSWSKYTFENYRGIILKGIPLQKDKTVSVDILKYLKKRYDIRIIANPATPVGIISIIYFKIKKCPYYIEGDGAQYNKNNFVKEFIKKKIIGGATGYFSTSKNLDYYFRAYGATSEIYRYPFSSIRTCDIQNITEIDNKKRQARYDLKISSEKIILAIGRFEHIKGFDVLIQAMKEINNAQCYIIGGKPTEQYLKIIKMNKITNIVFEDFKTPDELASYFLAADIFVLPTRYDPWGLVINEAMAYGLPVISTNKCVAALELISNDENGYVVDADNVDMLVSTMNLLLKNDELCKEMQQNNLKKISLYTIEKMVESHVIAFKQISECE